MRCDISLVVTFWWHGMVLAACDCHSHPLQHYWHQWHNVNQVHGVIVCKLHQENIINVQKCLMCWGQEAFSVLFREFVGEVT